MTDINVNSTLPKGEGTGTVERLPRRRITMTALQARVIRDALFTVTDREAEVDDLPGVREIAEALKTVTNNDLADCDISYAPDVLAPSIAEGK